MFEVHAARYLERFAKGTLAFVPKIVEPIRGRFIEVDLPVKDPLVKLVQSRLTVSVFSVNDRDPAVGGAENFAVLLKITEIFKLDPTYLHWTSHAPIHLKSTLLHRFWTDPRTAGSLEAAAPYPR